MENNTKYNDEAEVTITLKGWQVERLLGAARLGIWAEDWCYALWYSYSGQADTITAKWILCVGHVIKQIKEQTGITYERQGYGAVKDLLNQVDGVIAKKCQELEKEALERWKSEEKEGAPTEEDKKRLGVISVPITDEMIDKANDMSSRVMQEKR